MFSWLFVPYGSLWYSTLQFNSTHALQKLSCSSLYAWKIWSSCSKVGTTYWMWRWLMTDTRSNPNQGWVNYILQSTWPHTRIAINDLANKIVPCLWCGETCANAANTTIRRKKDQGVWRRGILIYPNEIRHYISRPFGLTLIPDNRQAALTGNMFWHVFATFFLTNHSPTAHGSMNRSWVLTNLHSSTLTFLGYCNQVKS